MDWEKFMYSPAGKGLLAAGAGGLLAGGVGALSGASSKRPMESKEERRKRILSNALKFGTLGAGAVGLAGLGAHQIGTALPEDGLIEKVLDDTKGLGLQAGGALGAVHGLGSYLDARQAPGKLQGILSGLAGSSKAPKELSGAAREMLKSVANGGDPKHLIGQLRVNPEMAAYLKRMGHGDTLLRSGIGGFGERLKNRLMGGPTFQVNNPIQSSMLAKLGINPSGKLSNLLTKAPKLGIRGNAALSAGALSAIPLYKLLSQ